MRRPPRISPPVFVGVLRRLRRTLGLGLVVVATACSPDTADGRGTTASPGDTGHATVVRSPVDVSPERVARLVAALPSADNTEAEAASDSLAMIGPAATAALIPVIEGNDLVARYFAVHAMVDYGPGAQAAVPALTRLVAPGRPNDRTHYDAIRALRSIGPAAAPAAPALVALLDVPINAPDSDTVLAALASIGPGARPALPALLPHLPKRGAPAAVARIGGPEALAALERALFTPSWHWGVKGHLGAVAAALASMGHSGLAVVDRARVADSAKVRAAAIAGYRSLEAEGVSGLVAMLGDARACRFEDFTTEPIPCRSDAARALGEIGPPARSSLPALERAIREADDARTQNAVRRAMADVRGDATR